jgi:hypothetical protein
MPSCMASSFSQGLAFICSKPERTMTLTSLAAEPACRAAAVHRGVATAEHDHPFADRGDVTESDVGQPVDTEVDLLGRRLAPGNLQVLTARCAGTDEHGVVTFGKQVPQRS